MNIEALSGLDLMDEEAIRWQGQLKGQILQFLFSQGLTSSDFQKMVAQLAWFGTRPESKWLLQRKILDLASVTFVIPGMNRGYIGWINGINNTFEVAKRSGVYLQTLSDGHTISGIYNRTHTVAIDLLESSLLNHNGYSPVTNQLLQNEWTAFHETNRGNSSAKLLQICHSQGALHVKNALENCPPEVRDRVIVIAIAPAAIVPKRLCFKSYNYASEKDIIYQFDPTFKYPLVKGVVDDVLVPRFGEISPEDLAELVILKPHAEATGLDHSFQSPTYRKVLIEKLEDYLQHAGEYEPCSTSFPL